jgi:hypothetical protein
MRHVFVETNWVVAYAAPAHMQVPAAAQRVRALRECGELHVVAECLRNKPSFDPDDVASAFLYHFSRFSRTYAYDRDDTSLSVSSSDDIFVLAGDRLLLTLLRHATSNSSLEDSRRSAEFVCAYTLKHIRLRKLRITDHALSCVLRQMFGTPLFTFIVGLENPTRFSLAQVIAKAPPA